MGLDTFIDRKHKDDSPYSGGEEVFYTRKCWPVKYFFDTNYVKDDSDRVENVTTEMLVGLIRHCTAEISECTDIYEKQKLNSAIRQASAILHDMYLSEENESDEFVYSYHSSW